MRVVSAQPVVGEQIVAAIQAAHQGWHHTGIALYKTPKVIAESAVPLTRHDPRKRPAQLIHPGGVPWLGNYTQLRQIRVGGHVAQQRRVRCIDRSVRVSGKDGSEVETKSVDMHLVCPMANAVHDHLADVAVRAIERVAGAGEVFVGCARPIRHQVVGAVVDPFVAIDWAGVIALARVIVDHVKDHLDIRFVQPLDHFTKRVVLRLNRVAAVVAMVGREEIQRRVAPVIPVGRVILENRHQFDDGDAKLLQVRNFLDQSRIRSARFVLDAGVRILGKSPNVQLVDDGIGLVHGAMITLPLEALAVARKHTQGRLARV